MRVAREGSEEEREAALQTLSIDHTLRQRRAEESVRLVAAPGALRPLAHQGGHPQRSIYDQESSQAQRLGKLVRGEGQPPTHDEAINEAYDGFGDTYKFYWDVFGRDSIDDRGMPILGLVHFARRYNNAFWDGQGHMFFGDGDGKMFTRLTKSIDVIGHELTHGVTQYEANLAYQDQSGALNESVSDVFGSLVEQYAKGETADQASWLIGADVVGDALKPALRSMKEPGHANRYDDQPADMDHFVETSEDNGGVHTNSGIPNHAFYVLATTLGGNAWDRAGRIWYAALSDPRLRPTSSFRGFARATLRQSQQRFGRTSDEAHAVRSAWEAVKVRL
jgi:Zn-dependent metalloprotease